MKKLFFVLMVLLCTVVFAQDIDTAKVASHILGGATYHIELNGGYCYAHSGSRFFVLDLTNPEEPVETGHLYLDGFHYFEVHTGDRIELSYKNNYVYFTNTYLSTIDVSDPTNPELTDKTGNFFHRYTQMSISDDNLYVLNSNQIYGYSLLDPSHPELIDSITVPGGSNHELNGDLLLYVTNIDEDYFLNILDISDITSPILIIEDFAIPEDADNMVYEDILYVFESSSDSDSLHVYDIHDPALPEEIGEYNVTEGFTHHFTNSYLVCESRYVIEIYDISDPTEIELVNSFDAVGSFDDAGICDSLLCYVTQFSHGDTSYDIVVYDIEESTEKSRYDLYNCSYTGFSGYSDPYLFMKGAQDYKTFIFDISDFNEPRLLSVIDDKLGNSYLYNNTLIISPGTSATQAFDFTDPTSPILTDELCGNAIGSGRGVNEGKFYVVTPDEGLLVFDISNPYHVTEISSIPEIDYLYGTLVFYDNYLYLKNIEDEVTIIDISDPTAPFITSSFSSSYDLMTSENGYLILTDNMTANYYDLTTPLTPTFEYSVTFPGIITNIQENNIYTFDKIYKTNREIIVDSLIIHSDDIHSEYILLYNSIVPIKNNVILTNSFLDALILETSHFTKNDFTSGWNLVSFPYTDTVDIATELPFAEDPAYKYNTDSHNYDETHDLFINHGFWVYSSTFGNFSSAMPYTPASSVTLELAPGWNLIGGPSSNILASVFESIPEIVSPLFYYDSYEKEYTEADIMEKHKGYWIIASDSVEVTIP